MRFQIRHITVINLLALMSLTSTAFAGGLAFEGERIAKKWCAKCHVVSDEQETALADVPSFKFIATRYADSLGVLGAFLADPHPVMPNLSLTRSEIQDLLAYIESQK
ncbi:MAG: c-type cytochrome [Pseudomonadota bacterium]